LSISQSIRECGKKATRALLAPVYVFSDRRPKILAIDPLSQRKFRDPCSGTLLPLGLRLRRRTTQLSTNRFGLEELSVL
jgi:hypothetical protein